MPKGLHLSRIALVVGLASLQASALATDQQSWSKIGDFGGPILWVAGLGSSLLQDGDSGRAHAARTFDGFLVTGLATELLKVTTREKRPYDNTFDSFPSAHASLSFSVAAAQAYYHPKQAPLWYGAAAVVSYARVAGHEHHPQDVLAGAILGFALGRASVTSRRGWIVAPYMEGGRPGLMFSMSR